MYYFNILFYTIDILSMAKKSIFETINSRARSSAKACIQQAKPPMFVKIMMRGSYYNCLLSTEYFAEVKMTMMTNPVRQLCILIETNNSHPFLRFEGLVH